MLHNMSIQQQFTASWKFSETLTYNRPQTLPNPPSIDEANPTLQHRGHALHDDSSSQSMSVKA